MPSNYDEYLKQFQDMSKSRLDSRVIAAIKSARDKLDTAQPTSRAEVIDLVAEELATELARGNPSFDRERFLAATRTEEPKGK